MTDGVTQVASTWLACPRIAKPGVAPADAAEFVRHRQFGRTVLAVGLLDVADHQRGQDLALLQRLRRAHVDLRLQRRRVHPVSVRCRGDLAIATTEQGAKTLQLVDLHGDIAGTVPVSGTGLGTLALMRTDEFGNPEPLAGASTANAPPRYGWLGASQRSGETLGGLTLMGVRLYSPATGRFLSVDPVPGGSANAYDYCSADPVNCTDLAGTFSFKSFLKVVAVVGEIASNIPGPVGAAAAGVSAVAYAAQGNKSKALEMGITAAAALVRCGPVVKVAAGLAAGATALRAGALAVRGVQKIARTAGAGREFKSTLEIGNAAHKAFERKVVRMGGSRAEGYIKSVSGRRLKPDGYTASGAPIELKPHNAAALRRGERQLARYEKATGMTGELWSYRQTRILKRFKFERIR